MESYELEELIKTQAVKKLSFDTSVFTIEFENGLLVEVEVSSAYDCGVWQIDSSIEKSEREERWRMAREKKIENDRLAKEKQQKILSKFPPEQWDEIRETFSRKN